MKVKHIEFFTTGYCDVNSIEEFMDGPICEYISRVFGTLRYTVNPRPNFIKVFEIDGGYRISDNLFYDRFPHAKYCGSIVPPTLDHWVAVDERGGNSPAGRSLDQNGYIETVVDIDDNLYNSITNSYYINSDFELECDISSMQTAGKYVADAPIDMEQQSFKITAEYYNAIMCGDKWHTLPFLEPFRDASKSHLASLFEGNYTISNCGNERTYLQKMTKGDSMCRHTDSSVSGVNGYLINGISWVTEGEFSGRELVMGYRSEEDLGRLITEALAMDNLDTYGTAPVGYTDTGSVVPSTGKTMYVNSFNPFYYHGVEALVGAGAVYTIINDFQPA